MTTNLNLDERVRYLFGLDIESKIALVDTISGIITKAAERLVTCLLNDGKIFVCGNGGSAANCLHFSAAMLNHYGVERPPLPVINLTTDTSMITMALNEGQFDQVFSKQIQALAQRNDLLMVISTAGHSNNILTAVNTAHECGLAVIALNGRDGGVLAAHLEPQDIEIRIQHEQAARIRETHLFILHCFCDLIEQSLFGQECP